MPLKRLLFMGCHVENQFSCHTLRAKPYTTAAALERLDGDIHSYLTMGKDTFAAAPDHSSKSTKLDLSLTAKKKKKTTQNPALSNLYRFCEAKKKPMECYLGACRASFAKVAEHKERNPHVPQGKETDCKSSSEGLPAFSSSPGAPHPQHTPLLYPPRERRHLGRLGNQRTKSDYIGWHMQHFYLPTTSAACAVYHCG